MRLRPQYKYKSIMAVEDVCGHDHTTSFESQEAMVITTMTTSLNVDYNSLLLVLGHGHDHDRNFT